MIDEPTFYAQSLNFLYAQFKAPSMTDSWCVCRITSNDHEPLIAHPGSYDADRCIHRNDHGQPRGRITPAGKQTAVLAVVVTIARGYVPTDSAARRHWEDKAASIAAYREMYGYDHPDDPIGLEPAREALDQRADWHQAFAALGPAGQPGVRALSDGQLWRARDTYAAETAWAPPYAGKELRLSRLGACDAALAAIPGAELRRRHPRQKIEPLRSAEPAPASDTGCDPLHPAPDGKLTEIAALIRDLAMQREEFRAEMDERPRRGVPGEDHGKAFREMKSAWQVTILQPPKPEIIPSASILQLAAEHKIEPEAGG